MQVRVTHQFGLPLQSQPGGSDVMALSSQFRYPAPLCNMALLCSTTVHTTPLLHCTAPNNSHAALGATQLCTWPSAGNLRFPAKSCAVQTCPNVHNLWRSAPLLPSVPCNPTSLDCIAFPMLCRCAFLPHSSFMLPCCQEPHTPNNHVPLRAGWTFAAEGDPPFKSVEGFGSFDTEGCIPDTVNGAKNVRELYDKVNDTSGGEAARQSLLRCCEGLNGGLVCLVGPTPSG